MSGEGDGRDKELRKVKRTEKKETGGRERDKTRQDRRETKKIKSLGNRSQGRWRETMCMRERGRERNPICGLKRCAALTLADAKKETTQQIRSWLRRDNTRTHTHRHATEREQKKKGRLASAPYHAIPIHGSIACNSCSHQYQVRPSSLFLGRKEPSG